MPPKRRAIGRSTPQARKRRALRALESDEQRSLILENLRVHATETRSSESSDQREVRLETDRIRTNQIRYSEITELRERRLQNVRISTARSRRTLHADLTATDRRSVEDGGKSVILKVRNIDIEVDNRWIVPHSPLLSKTFKAHINVEYCNSVKSIKYICKYINKGSDMAVFGVGNVAAPLDEINQYQLGRYISSNEAVWRILSFPIHERHPTVIHLAVHLENGQRVYFTADNVRARALVPPATTLTAFYSLCQDDIFAKTLLYSEVPKFYTDALGRLYTVHPNNTECFYLRLLLINIRGPISFQDLRTVNGQLCATYRQACQELNLLENDAHWDTALADAWNTARPQQIRTLFAIILTTCFPSNPKDLWEKYKDYMSEDILHRLRAENQNPDIQFTPNVYNEALILIEDICLTIANKALVQLGMPASNRPANNLFDRDLQRETHYDSDELGKFVRTNLPQLILEQRIAYDRIMRAITEQSGGLFFIDAPGGTGKTFLLSLILATIRSQNNIALAIASSGIAATFLDGGRTTHSALKLPLNLQNTEAQYQQKFWNGKSTPKVSNYHMGRMYNISQESIGSA
ncbi:ATP-dependent DNA helicase [Trichonephila clavipes]|nr:ATP-dependent DNA helicase [Trichonephila clavipes]